MICNSVCTGICNTFSCRPRPIIVWVLFLKFCNQIAVSCQLKCPGFFFVFFFFFVRHVDGTKTARKMIIAHFNCRSCTRLFKLRKQAQTFRYKINIKMILIESIIIIAQVFNIANTRSISLSIPTIDN